MECFKASIGKLVSAKEQMKKLEGQFKKLGVENVKQAIREGVAITEESLKDATQETVMTSETLEDLKAGGQ